jgi:hypothetical protein
MKPVFYSRIAHLLLLLTLLTATLQRAHATGAPIYSNTGAADATKVVQNCVTFLGATTCYGSVTNPELAADASLETGALMNLPLLALGTNSIGLRMDLARQAPANYRAGVVVSREGRALNLLNISLASALVVRTYLKAPGGESSFQEQMPVSVSVASAILAGSGEKMRLEFVASRPFDQVEIVAGTLVGLGYQLKVYYAYAIDANVVQTATGVVSRFEEPVKDTNYSTSVIVDGFTVCVNNEVIHPEWSVDRSLTNHATFGTMANVSCPTTLRTKLEASAPAGYFAGFVVGGQGLLDVSALNGMKITTYKNGVAQESAVGADLLRLTLLPDGQQQISFATTKEFDSVELTRTSLLSVLDNLSVFYGFGLEPKVFADQQPVLSNFPSAAGKVDVLSNGVGCVLCANVENPERAGDSNLAKDDYAEIRTGLLGGITSTALRMSLNGPGLAGNTAGVVLNQGPGLLNTQLLGSIKIKTYGGPDGKQLLETATGANLISQGLLADGRVELSFLTTQDFSRVELEVDNTISLLDRTRVYYAFAEDRPTGFPTLISPPAPLPVELVSFQAKATGAVVNLSWKTASEKNNHHFIVERALGTDATFRAIGQVAGAGTSQQAHSYQLQDAQASQLAASVLYYRLRQVDLDGEENVSPVVAVSFRAPMLTQMEVYPNPADGVAKVQVRLPQEPTLGATLALFGARGEHIQTQPAASRHLTLATTGLRSGLYYLVLTDAAGHLVATQRVAIATR